MSDRGLRVLERNAAQYGDDRSLLALRHARIRHGLDEVPVHWEGLVLDPLHLGQMRKKVEKVNKLLRKKGGLPLTLVESPVAEYIERLRQSDGKTVRIKVRQVSLQGDMPGADGRYIFVARLNHKPNATIIHRSRAGRDVPESVLEECRLAGPRCQHCTHDRRRNDTYVVQNTEDGTIQQVGSTCLDQYTEQDCNLVLYAFDKLKQLTEELDSGELDSAPVEEYGCSPLSFLAHYNRLGHIRQGMIRDQHAARAQQDALRYGMEPTDLSWETQEADITEAMSLLHRASSEMLPGLESHREGTMVLSERDHNIAVILESGVVSSREAGTFAAIYAWDGEAEQRREREKMMHLATDPEAQAIEMARLIPGAQKVDGNIILTPEMLAHLLLNEQKPSLLSLATIINNPQSLLVPAHDGDYLAAEGAQGTWELRVEACIPYSRGGGHVVKMSHLGADGVTRLVTVFAGGRNTKTLGEWGWVTGHTYTIQATVDRHNLYRNEKNVILTDIKMV
jgi:hypothetical protein